MAMVAPNGSGKTSLSIAPAILCFLTYFPRGQVPVTSSSWMQVEKQLFPALRRYMDNPFFDGWTFNKTEIRTPEGGFAVGFSTDNAGRAEGWHPKISPDVDPVFYVLDEAKTIQDFYKEAVDLKTVTAGKHVLGPRIEVTVEAGKGAGKAAWDAIAGFGATIKDNIPFTEKEEIDALNRKEVSAILAAADDIVDANLNQKTAVAAIDRGVTGVINAAKKMQSMVPGDDKDAGTLANDSRIGQRAIQNAGNTIIQIVTAGGKIGMGCAKAAIDYAERSMGSEGSSDDGKKKEDEKK